MTTVRGIIKVVALIVGACVTVVALMSLVGVHIANGWARGAIAIVVALLVPLLLVDRILAKRAPDKMQGVTTDVLALCYLGFALAFVGVAHGHTQPLLQTEARRLEAAGMSRMANLASLLAGGQASAAPPVVAVAPAVEPVESPPAEPVEAPPAELRAGDGKERTPAQIFTEFAPSVVTISVSGPMGEGGGTGFILDATGTIGTNFHVIAHATKITVKLMDGALADEVEILAENEPHDLALLRIKTSQQLPPVILGDSDKITVGERAVSIGNPLGLEHTLTDGLISSRRVMEGRKMIQMSTPISPGNSGGPLFNIRGEVVGVTTANYGGGFSRAQNLNLAMPVNDLRAMLRAEYPGRHKVGERSPKGGSW